MKLRVHKSGKEEYRNVTHYLESDDGETLVAECHFTGTDNKANAERLALVWNCHDELLAACEAVLAYHGKCIENRFGEEKCRCSLCERIRAAIALAKGD